MQILNQQRPLNRAIIFILIAIPVIAVSWGIASTHKATIGLPDISGYSADTTLRVGASIDEQIQVLQSHLRKNPKDWSSYSQLGLAYLQKARETGDPSYYQKAEESLDQSIKHQAADYVTVSGMGALALARHQFHSALEWGERARQLNPTRTYSYGILADAQIELGQYDEAVETLQTMVDLRPDMSSYSRISYLRELNGDIDGALELMQRAVDSGTPNSESTAWTRTQLGNLYFNTGDLEQAEAEYLQTLHDRPNYTYALAGLGKVRAAQGNLDEAIKLLTEATNIMPLPDFVITLGDLYHANNQPALAQQQYNLIGTIEKLFEANGVDMDMEIALFHADQNKDLKATVEQARKAYANRPSIHAADVLAWALYKTGNYKEAQTYSEQALRLETKDALKLFHAGMIAYRLGERARAQTYLEQALAINPHFSFLYAEEAQQTLDTLQAGGE
ncbi:MAG TPA: tetratricopeptide repeat protein [Anaerolineales bacterium]|nr:tetratricopeptide repeat protein [Anaerolineales bacterium]